MKTAHLNLQPRRQSRGVALIIVLAMLLLLSGLIVAFMNSAGTERAASAANAGLVNSRQMADSTVNLVIGQIRDATSPPSDDATWASQPGAIRTFAGKLDGSRKTLRDQAYYDGYSPSPNDSVYKLYSADKFTVPAAEYTSTDLADEVKVIDNWKALDPSANPSDYVDLNEPILSLRLDINPDRSVVEPRYPIIDPRAKLDLNNADVNGSLPGIVDGFDAKLTKHATLTMPNAAGTAAGAKVPLLPMPVKWLYILRDGSIGSANKATATNPIVGRTAFWTDDESCKLNINTASEATYWESPTASNTQTSGDFSGNSGTIIGTNFGLQLAASQPIRGEIQRYPGHPATTCLSPVLGQLFPSPNGPILPATANSLGTSTFPWLSGGSENTLYKNFKEALYQMLPFTPYSNAPSSAKGTSHAATRNTDVDGPIDNSLPIKTKHLYTSIDEVLFKSERNSGANFDPLLNSPLTPANLEKVRFFLTANSRAPEINLFGRPRITLWPISAAPKYRTAYDDLFLFASTVAKDGSGDQTKDKKYCFLRWEAKSATQDYDGTWPTIAKPDAQNAKMYKYLQTMTAKNVPGFTGISSSFFSKWPSAANGGPIERDQILTMIFDYMRSVNLVDTGTSGSAGNVFVPYTPRFFPVGVIMDYNRLARSFDWSGQVTPIRITNTQGMGRFLTPTEVALIFYGTTGSTPKVMRCALGIEMATVMAGLPGLRDTYYTVVKPGQSYPGEPNRVPVETKIKVGDNTTSTGIKLIYGVSPLTAKPGEGLINICNISNHELAFGRAFMPVLGFTPAMHYFTEHKSPSLMQSPPEAPDNNRTTDYTVNAKTFANNKLESLNYKRGDTVKVYPYVSDPIPLLNKDGKTAATTFELEGGNFDIEIWSGEAPDDPRRTLVQTVHVDFPKGGGGAIKLPAPTSTAAFETRFDKQLDGTWNVIKNAATDFDVVRSMELTCGFDNKGTDLNKCGDVRLAAARIDVPSTFFRPRADWLAQAAGLVGTPLVHGLTCGHGDPFNGYYGTQGKLVANGSPRISKPAILPANVNGVTRFDGGPGDWDRGISKHMDGALCNKVDEGNLRFDYTQSGAPAIPYYRGRNIEETGQTWFSPNRELSSPVMLGSIPTGVVVGKPWQTLLFRPNRESGTTHPGADISFGPPDHLILDLFTVPVVEPYAISEPFSTAGKVNLNYVIAPFGYAKGDSGFNTGTNNQARSYIRRDTALRGVLKSEFVMAIPTAQPDGGHTENPLTGSGATTNFYFPVNLNRTLEALETRLKAKDGQYPLFRSASEICTVDLYPHLDTTNASVTVTDWNLFWNTTNAATGDNMRERPYSHIYPRLTTKSNVYTVHMRCQSIRKSPISKSDEFDPKLDAVVGEYRGSATIERFIDPNDPALANYDEQTTKVDPFYRYRIVNTKHFAPR